METNKLTTYTLHEQHVAIVCLKSLSHICFLCDPYGHECPHVQPLCPSGKLERGSLPGGGKTHDQCLWAGNELKVVSSQDVTGPVGYVASTDFPVQGNLTAHLVSQARRCPPSLVLRPDLETLLDFSDQGSQQSACDCTFPYRLGMFAVYAINVAAAALSNFSVDPCVCHVV